MCVCVCVCVHISVCILTTKLNIFHTDTNSTQIQKNRMFMPIQSFYGIRFTFQIHLSLAPSPPPPPHITLHAGLSWIPCIKKNDTMLFQSISNCFPNNITVRYLRDIELH